MKARLLVTLAVPKAEYCWPLMASSAAGPWTVSRADSAFRTVLKSPVAFGLAMSSALPTAYWFGVRAPAAKALVDWNRSR